MTYEYVCSACGHEWEAEQRISDDPLRDCPKCDQTSARRQVSGGQGFILKGGGWYADGYAGGPTSNAAETDSKADQSAESGKDSKPAQAKEKAASESGSKAKRDGTGGGSSEAAAA